jgi:hypothetical protein
MHEHQTGIDKAFWRIILASFNIMEIENLACEAKRIEDENSWNRR